MPWEGFGLGIGAGILLGLCKVLDLLLNGGIVCLAIFEAVWFVRAMRRLKGLSARTESLVQTVTVVSPSRKTGALALVDTISTARLKDWEAFVCLKEDYGHEVKIYDMFVAVIQVFPLLGILGTVAGLYLSLNDVVEAGMRFSYDGIGFALSSTILGIVFSVIFKMLDAVFTAPLADTIEIRLDLFEKDYEVRSAAAVSAAGVLEEPVVTVGGNP